jgi:hypothetical protein
MKLAIYALLLSSIAYAAPAPYPVTINSRVQTAPGLSAYRGNETVFRVTFTDGATASDLTNTVPFMRWATSNTAVGVSTSYYSFVGSTASGVVDFTFSPSSLNFTPGLYIYEAGILVSGTPRTYRQGSFRIEGSPVGAGVAALTLTTNINWTGITWLNLPDYQTGAQVDAKIAASPVSITITNGLASTSYVNQAITAGTNGLVTRTVTNGLLGAESDTLQSVAARGGFAGTETISPLLVTSKRFGINAGASSSGNAWGAFGDGAGQANNGNDWGAYGCNAGIDVVGNGWGAYGNYAGYLSRGNYWSAMGYNSGKESVGDSWTAVGHWTGGGSVWTNSAAFGSFAGSWASGSGRLYIDVYNTDPAYDLGGATNDMIFGDNGQLNLGRIGPLTNASPNLLRGSWNIGTPTGSGASLTGITAAQVGAVSTNDTGFVNLTGATVQVSSPVNGKDVANADWVRSLFSGGYLLYSSTNVSAVDATAFQFLALQPAANAVRTYNAVTQNQYIGSVITTSRFTTVYSPITVNAYIGQSAAGPDAVTVKPEIYYSYDGTNWLGDWDGQAQTITAGSNLYQWAISFPTIISTNSTGVWIKRVFKVASQTSTPDVSIYMGGTTPSHIGFTAPPELDPSLGARGATGIRTQDGASTGTYDAVNRMLTMPSVTRPDTGSYATNIWSGPASAQSVTNANTVYFTW